MRKQFVNLHDFVELRLDYLIFCVLVSCFHWYVTCISFQLCSCFLKHWTRLENKYCNFYVITSSLFSKTKEEIYHNNKSMKSILYNYLIYLTFKIKIINYLFSLNRQFIFLLTFIY